MDVLVASLTVPGLRERVRQGASHPLLDPFLDAGTWCTVDGVEGAAEILAAARQAAEAGLPLLVLGDGAAPSDLLRVGQRAALCLIVADLAARSRPLAVLYGRHLPALGAVPSCTVRDLRHTWTALAGGMPDEGRHLLQEQPETWDPHLERQLTQRLRQLYGE